VPSTVLYSDIRRLRLRLRLRGRIRSIGTTRHCMTRLYVRCVLACVSESETVRGQAGIVDPLIGKSEGRRGPFYSTTLLTRLVSGQQPEVCDGTEATSYLTSVQPHIWPPSSARKRAYLNKSLLTCCSGPSLCVLIPDPPRASAITIKSSAALKILSDLRLCQLNPRSTHYSQHLTT
jgi:hypothetical protein